jgi:hypothetical protein
VAKVLAARLSKVLGDLIPNTQSTFLKGRQLVDGVVVVNEVIDFAKKSGKKCLILKVDFEKAYDLVDWGFLDYILRCFGFDDKWRAWMKACVCSGSMSILVNGSPTEEICIKRGLKQGDPLAPLLFLLVAEGLGGLMRKAVERGRFQPFKVGRGGMPVSILQYADDTLCIGTASVENLWALKAILRGFEMTSDLRVNFGKSCLVGINVPNDFMCMASDSLNCRIGHTPFKYLGLPVGANPRLSSTWKPMVDAIKKRLGSWGNKFISLGGRIVLINAVLNSMPVFFLSYLKIPVKVWREVVKIQRTFLWGGLSNRRKVCWVKWKDICRPKKDGGLGIRDVRIMNLSLLAKWRWKLLVEGNEVWRRVVVARYGSDVVGNLNLAVDALRNGTSGWWRDLCRLDVDGGWLKHVVEKRLGNGSTIRFWKDVWVAGQSLQELFPRLFGISTQKEAMISDVGWWDNGVWRWGLMWRRNFFVWEENLLVELLNVVSQVTLSEVEDRWVWIPGGENNFSVKSLYVYLESNLMNHVPRSPMEAFAFKYIWKSGAPSKVCAMAWQLFLDRIPTREILSVRGVILPADACCPFCVNVIESSVHIFLHCRIAAAIWYRLARWLGLSTVLPPSVLPSYVMMVGFGSNKTRRRVFSIVWLAFVWAIWKSRNDRIFNNKDVSVEELVDYIQRLSWVWFIKSVAKGPCLLYEWCWSPGDCMMR